MIRRIVLSVIVAIVVALLCIVIADFMTGGTSATLNKVGDFIGSYCGLIGVLAGLWYFFGTPR